jgi:hypothetical protein
MPTTAKTAAQTWIRAELVGVPDSAFGPQLMIPADGLEFHGPDLVFHRDGEVVYVTRPDQLRSLTWLGPATDPERERRRAQWPNHGKRWTGEQRESLRGLILAGTGWTEIAKTHGRTRTGVQQEAVKQGWVEADTLRPTAALIDEGGGGSAPGDTGDGSGGTSPQDRADTASDSAPGDTESSSTTVASGLGDTRVPDPADDPTPSASSHRVRLRSLRHGNQAESEATEVAPDTTEGSPDPTHSAQVTIGAAPIGTRPGDVPATPVATCPEPPAPFPTSALTSPGVPESPPLPPFPARALGSYAVGLSPRAPATFPDDGPTGADRTPGQGPGPGQGSGRGAPPWGADRKPPAVPHPREPDRLPANHYPGHRPGDRVLTDGLRATGPHTPTRPPGT